MGTHLAEEVPSTGDEIETLFSSHFRYTLGQLLKKARSRVAFPPETDELIAEALEARNVLIHRFFGDRSEDFLSDAGRLEMARDLRDMVILFRRADEASTPISSRIFASLGITPEILQAELASMKARAAERDRAV